MPRGGKREGAGRKPDSKTKKTRKVAEAILDAGGVTPLDVMLQAMNTFLEAGDMAKAASFAKDAAPYMHARLSAITANTTVNGQLTIISEFP